MGAAITVPASVTATSERQPFMVTVEYAGGQRLPSRPLAPIVHWQPCGVNGYPRAVIIHNTTDEYTFPCLFEYSPGGRRFTVKGDEVILDTSFSLDAYATSWRFSMTNRMACFRSFPFVCVILSVSNRR